MNANPWVNPEFGIWLTKLLSWIMIGLGLIKLVLYMIGERHPEAFRNIKSEGIRKFLTGTGNRLLFGLGGLATLVIGGFGLLAAIVLEWLFFGSGRL